MSRKLKLVLQDADGTPLRTWTFSEKNQVAVELEMDDMEQTFADEEYVDGI